MAIHPELAVFPKEDLKAPLIGFARSEPPGETRSWHSHDEGQLFHVIKGSIAIATNGGTFFVPPERALWIPPGVEHQARYLTDTDVRYIYVQPEWARELPDTPHVVHVTVLLRALILEFMSYPRAETFEGPAARLAEVIRDQLQMLPAAPLELPMPLDERLGDLCERALRCPANLPTLEMAAREAAMSERSFERKIKAETGMSYRTWCRQVKLFRALELLATGRSVSDISHKLGYEGPSAFIASFKKAFGVTPGRYFEN